MLLIFAPSNLTKWLDKTLNAGLACKYNKDMSERKEIIVKWGVTKRIAREVGCNPLTVRYALRGITDSDLARKIRREAVKRYGGVKA